MDNWTHGGNIYTAHGEAGDMLDFSASLNPLGMPPQVAQAAREGIAASVHYPDPNCIALREAISRAESVPVEQILCGNGAAELLDRLILAMNPRRAMLLAPTFGEYERALRMNGCHVLFHYLKPERNFDLTTDILRVFRPGLDLFILCNPNNPTGRAIPPTLLMEILRRCQELGTTLLVDESFLDMTDEEKRADLKPFLTRFPNLVLLRSLTKSYCMPGLRLGYLLTGDTGLLKKMIFCGQPWAVSVPAQYAGTAAMGCLDWPSQGRALIFPQRIRLTEELKKLGLRVWESSVNYLLFCAPNHPDLRERLLSYGILIRSCANFRGLGECYYRIAVRTEAENTALLWALNILCREGRG